MLLINCKLYLILTWSSSFVITNSAGAGTFAITDTKPYVVTLSTQGNIRLLNQLKLGLKITVNWNKYHQKGFVFSFESDAVRTGLKSYFLPTLEIKD